MRSEAITHLLIHEKYFFVGWGRLSMKYVPHIFSRRRKPRLEVSGGGDPIERARSRASKNSLPPIVPEMSLHIVWSVLKRGPPTFRERSVPLERRKEGERAHPQSLRLRAFAAPAGGISLAVKEESVVVQ